MSIGEAIKFYRDYKNLPVKEFSILVFVSADTIEEAERTYSNECFSVDDLIELFKFFSMRIGSTDDEMQVKDHVAHLLKEEIKKRTK